MFRVLGFKRLGFWGIGWGWGALYLEFRVGGLELGFQGLRFRA